jgi:tetratricopeptide (TPR) repeat protein
MLKTRLLLIGICAVVVVLIFQLPKAVVENEDSMANGPNDSVKSHLETHIQTPKEIAIRIDNLRELYQASTEKEKNAIFADSLATLYNAANNFDSAAWFAEEASKFFNNIETWTKAGDNYYQAYTLALDQAKQKILATKAQEFYQKVLDKQPKNLEIKTKLAMTYLSSSNPMQGIGLLREVLAEDPKNELALFNMGMLSIQSGQYQRAVERLEELIKVNPEHLQGNLLLGLALMNSGDRKRAKEQFEKVKQMDKDPAVQATVNSYLKDLK